MKIFLGKILNEFENVRIRLLNYATTYNHDLHFQGPEFEYDLSTKTCISKTPQVPDPYEELFVFVDQSSIPEAEEGLFAKTDIEESTVISFYNGTRLDVLDPDNSDIYDWPYKISLNEDWDLDIPEGLRTTDKYKATLGHKVS